MQAVEKILHVFCQCPLIEPQHSPPGILCRGLVVHRSRIIKEGMRGVGIEAHFEVFFVRDYRFDQFIEMRVNAYIFRSIVPKHRAGDILDQFNRVRILTIKYDACSQCGMAGQVDGHTAAKAKANADDLPALHKTLGIQIVYGFHQVLGQLILWDTSKHHRAHPQQRLPLFYRSQGILDP